MTHGFVNICARAAAAAKHVHAGQDLPCMRSCAKGPLADAPPPRSMLLIEQQLTSQISPNIRMILLRTSHTSRTSDLQTPQAPQTNYKHSEYAFRGFVNG